MICLLSSTFLFSVFHSFVCNCMTIQQTDNISLFNCHRIIFQKKKFFIFQFCREQNPNLLLDLYNQNDNFQELGNSAVRDSMKEQVHSIQLTNWIL